MKKTYWIVLTVLLVWCSYLSFELSSVRQQQNSSSVIQNVNQYTLNGYTTDLTDIVEKTEDKVVSVTGINHEWESSFGSGVVYSVENNLTTIATNYHVLVDVDEIRVTFHNGQSYEATMIGFDEYSDLALIQVETDFKVEPFTFGDSNFLKKGEYVLGIGNPINEEFFGTVTFGIISGKDRTFLLDTNKDGKSDWDITFLQTDAAVNPGNSGGALINMSGDLVGIMTMRVAGANTEGMNFAIGINEAIPILDQLMEKREIRRSILGLQGEGIVNMSVDQKGYLGIPLDVLKGIFVTSVFLDTPAKNMEIQSGDIILSINGVSINQSQDLRNFLYKNEPGVLLEIVLLRNGSEVIVSGQLR